MQYTPQDKIKNKERKRKKSFRMGFKPPPYRCAALLTPLPSWPRWCDRALYECCVYHAAA